MKNKKGQLGSVPGIVMIIIFALIILGIGFLFIQEILDLDNLSNQYNTATENGAWVNSTPYTLSMSDEVHRFHNPVILTIVNASDGTTLTAANYTLTDDGQLTNASGNPAGYDFVNLSYGYNYAGDTYLGVNSTISAFLDVPNLMSLVVLVVMVGIIIAILMGFSPSKAGTGA